MISSNIFRILAVAGLGALAAPAEAAVFQASTTGSWGETPLASTSPSRCRNIRAPERLSA